MNCSVIHMWRCLPLHQMPVKQFKDNLPQSTIARKLGMSSSRSIIFKSSANLEKSLHVSDKAENQHLMPMSFNPSFFTKSFASSINRQQKGRPSITDWLTFPQYRWNGHLSSSNFNVQKQNLECEEKKGVPQKTMKASTDSSSYTMLCVCSLWTHWASKYWMCCFSELTAVRQC